MESHEAPATGGKNPHAGTRSTAEAAPGSTTGPGAGATRLGNTASAGGAGAPFGSASGAPEPLGATDAAGAWSSDELGSCAHDGSGGSRARRGAGVGGDDQEVDGGPDGGPDFGDEAEAGAVNVGQLERVVSGLLGGVLAGTGLQRGSLSGLLVAAVGGALVFRGVTGRCPLYARYGVDTTRGYDQLRPGGRAHGTGTAGERQHDEGGTGEGPDEAALDEALKETFPASDPPALR